MGRKRKVLSAPKYQQAKVKMLLPTTIRCGTCGRYISKGTKFNSGRETVVGEKYLGIQIHRFCFQCTNCTSDITIKTNPESSDYIVESGATRVAEQNLNESESKRVSENLEELLADYEALKLKRASVSNEEFLAHYEALKSKRASVRNEE